MNVQVLKLDPHAKLPEYATDGSGCFDIFCIRPESNPVKRIYMGDSIIFSTGLSFEIPEGHVMLVYSRSGHGFKTNTRLANCVAVIDSDYRGELKIKLMMDTVSNCAAGAQDISDGAAIAQGMIIPIPKIEFVEVQELSTTARGVGGFGSTDTPLIVTADEAGVLHGNWGLTKEQQGSS